ncbi:MAG: 4-hydroxythreonine-4-phosphate dehydrogenase PdxA, partial [Planctomycetaceae bacterium]
MPRPLIALTLGDVAGIGPEVVVRACADERVRRVCRPVVVGHPQVVERAVRLSGVDVNVAPVSGPEACEALPTDEQSLPCWNPAGDEAAAVEPGRLDPRAGRAAYDCLIAATRAALQGQVAAVATAPLNKAALHLAGLHYPGHTEILAEACGTAEFAMMLYLPPGEIERAYGPRPVGSAGAQPRGFDLSSLISHLSSSWQLTAVGERGRIVVSGSDDPSAWHWQAEGDAAGDAPAVVEFDAGQAALKPFEAALRGESVRPNWTDLTRAVEILDAARQSLRRRRTIDLHFETASERSQFKTQMTALGCGVLALTLLAVVVVLIAGALFP